MTRNLVCIAAAAGIAAAALAIPTSAEARNGGAVAAGIIGGLAVGALIGSAAANNGPYYAPAPAYYPAPACYWQTQRFWDGWGWRFRRVQICN